MVAQAHQGLMALAAVVTSADEEDDKDWNANQ
jgi:hypothetical protein